MAEPTLENAAVAFWPAWLSVSDVLLYLSAQGKRTPGDSGPLLMGHMEIFSYYQELKLAAFPQSKLIKEALRYNGLCSVQTGGRRIMMVQDARCMMQ